MSWTEQDEADFDAMKKRRASDLADLAESRGHWLFRESDSWYVDPETFREIVGDEFYRPQKWETRDPQEWLDHLKLQLEKEQENYREWERQISAYQAAHLVRRDCIPEVADHG